MVDKSNQERRIDGIINACEEMQYCVSEMDYRLSFIRLLEKINAVTEEIEMYIIRSKDELLTNIDKGFNYAKKAEELKYLYKIIANPRSLKLKIEERYSKYLVSDEAINKDYIKEAAQKYVPYDDEHLEEFDDEGFMEVYEKAGRNNFISLNNMQLFLKKALSGLAEKMKELDGILYRGDKKLYPSLFEKHFGEQKLIYTIGRLKADFDKWRDDHDATVEDDKWKKKILDHAYVCMTELFRSGFLDYYENTLAEDDKESLRQECAKNKLIKSEDIDLYLNLCDIVEITFDAKGLKYKPSEKKIGRYLYQHRNDLSDDAIDAFKKFLASLHLHREALIYQPKKILDYETPKFQFKKLLLESTWIGKVLTEGYNTNYLEQFLENLFDSEYKDYIAKGWEKPKGRDKMRGHLLGALMRAGILNDNASEIGRLYIGKKSEDAKTFASYVTEGKKRKNCQYSDWVYDYVNPEG